MQIYFLFGIKFLHLRRISNLQIVHSARWPTPFECFRWMPFLRMVVALFRFGVSSWQWLWQVNRRFDLLLVSNLFDWSTLLTIAISTECLQCDLLVLASFHILQTPSNLQQEESCWWMLVTWWCCPVEMIAEVCHLQCYCFGQCSPKLVGWLCYSTIQQWFVEGVNLVTHLQDKYPTHQAIWINLFEPHYNA